MSGIRYDLTDTIVPQGAVVGTTDTQNLYNKTMESPVVTAGLTTDWLDINTVQLTDVGALALEILTL
jgi:hypothetical protein